MVKVAVARVAFHDLVDIILAFGTRTDDGHCATKDVVELGYFVEADFAHEVSERCDARVVVLAQGGAGLFSVDVHGTEFVHVEGSSVEAYGFLGEEDGSRRGCFDDDGCGELDG